MGELTSNGHKIVDGVLKSNIDVRNKHLSRNNGKYSLFEGEFDNAIGAAVDIKTRTLSDIKGGMTLYDYTSDKKTPLGEKIQNTYFNNNAEKELYSVLNPSPSELLRWNGKYENYIKYVSEVYGKEYTVIRLIDELFADLDITYAMNLTKVGVVKDINVPLALAGVNTTNINNYSGTDTRLGRLTNQIYASKLYQASVFNSSRGTKYITPSLSAVYGNNLQNLARLSDIMVPNPKTGRIADFDEVEYLVSLDKPDDVKANNGQYEYIPTAVTNHTEYVVTGATFSLENKLFDGLRMTVSNVNVKNKKSSPPKDYFIYQDVRGLSVNDSNNEWETFHLSGDTKTLGDDIGKKNLLSATQNLFSKGKIDTMIGRYYLDGEKYKSSVIDTAIDDSGGRSHGRNLLQKGKTSSGDGSDNPYCRTWTLRNQYKKVENQIRPFSDSSNRENLKKANVPYRANGNGDYLSKNTVLNLENGRVNVAPSKSGKVDIKKCMFSIENLAWKDVLKPGKNLSKEQVGPSGGRIMWFPPYGLDFSESVSAEWDHNTFIGRGEDVYTYKKTTRSANLSFILLIDHPSLLNSMRGSKDTTDSDILRFFAGCDVPDLKEATKKATEAATDASKEMEWDQSDGEFIEVSVYFPNNYSGNGKLVKKDIWSGYEKDHNWKSCYGCSDDEDWINYILKGRNATKFEDGNGYEIDENKGITDLNSDLNKTKNEYILACDKTSAWTECTNENSNNNKYWYRVDFDLRQNGIDVDKKTGERKYKINYEDSKSFALNSVVNNDNGKKFSFKDFHDYIFEGKNGGSKLFKLLSGSTITKVEVRGVATQQDKKNRDMLAERRAMTLGCTVMRWFNEYGEELGITLSNDLEFKRDLLKGDNGTKDIKTINDKPSKTNRRASVRIYYNKSEVTNVNGSGKNTGSGNTASSNAVVNKKGGDTLPSLKTANTVAYDAIEVTPNRYESESDFFDKLKRTEPVIWKRIKDKIRYFDPAYHSISPEGFNARLTFLQQCTRQGHTISATENDGSAMTAGNLAFGRMPVCVLRIGDFIHTKIVITSLSINYSVSNGMQWDMNEEGAGVQPMMAKVTIAFNIIGGQSLEAPINRLQNAVSFNYYANAGVYDDRADKAHLDREKLIYDNLFTVNKK